MVHYTKVFQGFAAFLDQEIMPRLSGISKWLFGGAAELALLNAQKNFQAVKGSPLISMLDVVHGEEIDVDKAYQVIRKQAEREPAVIALPVIGEVKLNEGDVDTIYRLIKGA